MASLQTEKSTIAKLMFLGLLCTKNFRRAELDELLISTLVQLSFTRDQVISSLDITGKMCFRHNVEKLFNLSEIFMEIRC